MSTVDETRALTGVGIFFFWIFLYFYISYQVFLFLFGTGKRIMLLPKTCQSFIRI